MYVGRIAGGASTGALLAYTGSTVPFAAYIIASALMLGTGLVLLRIAYHARARAPRHAALVEGSGAVTAAPGRSRRRATEEGIGR